jgi:hypothetical protein
MSCNYRELQPAVHGSCAAESAWRDESMACDKPLDVSELFRTLGELLSFGGESAFPTSCMRMETMTFARQAGATVFLVTLTLSMQCAGIAVLISWARASIDRGIARLSSLHAAVLMIRFSTLVIVLHFLQIFVWSVFYRWYCLPSWESSFYFSATSYSTIGRGDVVLPGVYRLMGPVESVPRAYVWHLRKWPHCIGDQVGRA